MPTEHEASSSSPIWATRMSALTSPPAESVAVAPHKGRKLSLLPLISLSAAAADDAQGARDPERLVPYATSRSKGPKRVRMEGPSAGSGARASRMSHGSAEQVPSEGHRTSSSAEQGGSMMIVRFTDSNFPLGASAKTNWRVNSVPVGAEVSMPEPFSFRAAHSRPAQVWVRHSEAGTSPGSTMIAPLASAPPGAAPSAPPSHGSLAVERAAGLQAA
mmetsp:Transcript_37021/g.66250  ORF Transcript_37021/g.66250 Transcript_37021/m.66250 type:complete len:217 (-) Transcript_37021:1329-1979(-)